MTAALSIADAVTRLRDGGIVAYPTEAVWGLGCDPGSQTAVSRLLSLKQRAVEKGLILIAADIGMLHGLLHLDALPEQRLAAVMATWPGPTTWVIPAHRDAPGWITGSHSSIAVRVSAHPDVVALSRAFGGALVSTSANLTGQTPAYRRDQLDPRLTSAIDGVLQGETEGLARPTSIYDALTGATLRH
ncbi:MAG: Sua5/YciO/YrdC/YwlC family protein [Xanthomonadaceae bacterium]|jgi:L-threonylcarbamoyladenylate synthase|nr:Sua5/YciO/YrdC/YwlC family protein [Xanthomonadaceae bacterium]